MEQPDQYLIILKQIRRLSRALDVQSRHIDRQVGLTLPQLIVLRALGEMGEVTSRALSARAGISPPTVVGILDKLEAKGLIERYRSQKDRRIVHAHLTARGRAALQSAPDPLGARISGGFNALSPQERAIVVSGLSLLGEMAAVDADGQSDA